MNITKQAPDKKASLKHYAATLRGIIVAARAAERFYRGELKHMKDNGIHSLGVLSDGTQMDRAYYLNLIELAQNDVRHYLPDYTALEAELKAKRVAKHSREWKQELP